MIESLSVVQPDACEPGPARAGVDAASPDGADTVQLRMRVIAPENLFVGWLADDGDGGDGADGQCPCARGSLDVISPRSATTPHTPILCAAEAMRSRLHGADRRGPAHPA